MVWRHAEWALCSLEKYSPGGREGVSPPGRGPGPTSCLPALCDPLPHQLPLCFVDLSRCSPRGGKHILFTGSLSLHQAVQIHEPLNKRKRNKKKKKKRFEMLAESLKGKLVYCLGRRIPVVHILRFPALKSWYSFACLSPASLPGMCKYTWNERNDQKKVFLRWEKVHLSPLWTWNISRVFIYLFLVGCCFTVSPL